MSHDANDFSIIYKRVPFRVKRFRKCSQQMQRAELPSAAKGDQRRLLFDLKNKPLTVGWRCSGSVKICEETNVEEDVWLLETRLTVMEMEDTIHLRPDEGLTAPNRLTVGILTINSSSSHGHQSNNKNTILTMEQSAFFHKMLYLIFLSQGGDFTPVQEIK